MNTVTNTSERTIELHDGTVLEPGASAEFATPLPFHKAVQGLIDDGQITVTGGALLMPGKVTGVYPPQPQVPPVPTHLGALQLGPGLADGLPVLGSSPVATTTANATE